MPVSIKDGHGVEIERLYSDQWGGYNGMTPSTWQVNVAGEWIRDLAIAFSIVAVAVGPAGIVIAVSSLRV